MRKQIMGIAEIYRKIIPIYWRYKISNFRKAGPEKRLLKEIKAGRFKEEYPTEWEYLVSKNAIVPFPYTFHDEYICKNVDVFRDSSCKMLYVIHDGKRLYFPKGWAKTFVQKYYLSLIEEQNVRSPHRYFPKDDSFVDGSIFFDVGAAEGIISLSVIDRIDRAVLFEADPMWREALNQTFAGYKDKIQIISKYCSDEVSDLETTLDEEYKKIIDGGYASESETRCVVKADVEGMEMKVLSGSTSLLESNLASFLICLYHHPNDEETIERFLQGYRRECDVIEKTDGYIFYGVEAGDPSFRRGLIRLIRK